MNKLGLIGFAGSGKSSVLNFAKAGGFMVLDTDKMLEKLINIDKFISGHDEIEFRKLERSIVLEALDSDADVIAFGGGVHSGHISWRIIRQAEIRVVFLKQSFEKCIERAPHRPLLKKVGMESYRVIFEERQDMYEKAADRIVTVNDQTLERVWYEVKKVWN